MYDSYIDIIGDKMGGDSVVYFTDPTEFEHRLNKLHSISNIPFVVLIECLTLQITCVIYK